MSGIDDERRRKLPVHVLRHRDYRYIWMGQFVSMLGTQMHAAALSWQVYELTGSAVQLGLLGLIRAVAILSTSLIGGAVADAFNRRTVLLVTQAALMLLSVVIAVATMMGSVTIWLLYVVAALAAATSAFDGPARQALIPALVPRRELAPAMSMNILVFSVARMVGPAVGGVAVGKIGLSGTYMLDAASFLFVIAALLVMKTRMEPPMMRGNHLEAIVEGLSFIRRTPVIWGVITLDFLATLLGSTVGLAPVFATDVLNIGPEGFGLLLSAPAAGAVLGGLLIALIPQPGRPGMVMVGAVVGYGACLMLFGASTTLVVALLALAGAGAADSVSVAMRAVIRNLATPDPLRGRVAAAHSAMAMGGPRLGEFQSGVMAGLVGPRIAMIAGGAAVVVASLAMGVLVPKMSRSRLDELDAEAGEPEQPWGETTEPATASGSAGRVGPGGGR
ncbi:MAG TPA: MFS transporter [Thermomicrobiales bacterium]|nr:MFS transporter [Thermomicrobiales bacterium]